MFEGSSVIWLWYGSVSDCVYWSCWLMWLGVASRGWRWGKRAENSLALFDWRLYHFFPQSAGERQQKAWEVFSWFVTSYSRLSSIYVFLEIYLRHRICFSDWSFLCTWKWRLLKFNLWTWYCRNSALRHQMNILWLKRNWRGSEPGFFGARPQWISVVLASFLRLEDYVHLLYTVYGCHLRFSTTLQ